MSDVLIVIPTYNEAENLPKIVPAALEALPCAHVLVVDDASPDGTGQLADALAAADPRVHVLHGPGKGGLGKAYVRGFQWALQRDYAFVFEMDADFSHQPRHLPELLAAAEAGADLVIGSRYVSGGGTANWGLSRRLISRGGGLYSRLVLGLPVADPTGGFKCFRRGLLQALDWDKLISLGFGFQIEVNYRVHLMGFGIKEVPIVFPDREEGTSKMSGAIFGEALLNVWRLRLHPDLKALRRQRKTR